MPVLLLDFDGTVCVGDAPVWAYADAVIERAGAAVADRIRASLTAYLAGDAAGGDHVDGYAAVAALATDAITADGLQDAYRASRRALQTGGIEVSAPEGLRDLLADLGPRVRRMLVTNAPAAGVATTLTAIGLADVIDAVVTDAGKPDGWQRILPAVLAGRTPQDVMAVGDIWENDLRMPHAAGCATALIDRFGRQHGVADLRAPRFEDLYDGIRDWAADPARFAAARTTTTTHDAAPAASVL